MQSIGWLKENSKVTEGGKEIGAAQEVEFLKNEDGYAIYSVLSGSYSFTVN